MKQDEAFRLIESTAAAGDRCPQRTIIPSLMFCKLARQGKIRVRIFARNWRVVDVLVGPYAGRSTADDPQRRVGEKPYKVVDASAPALRVEIPKQNRQEPWKPGQPRPAPR